MMHKPTSEMPSSPFNPYAAPQTQSIDAKHEPTTPFQPRPWIILCVGLVGLVAQYIGFLALRPGIDLTPAMMALIILEISKGLLAGMGVGIFVDALLQRKFSLLAPGHWFLLLMLASRAAQFGVDLWGSGADIKIGLTSFGMWYLVQTVIYQGLVLLLLTPIVLTTAEPLRWKALAWSTLVFSLVTLFQFPAALLDQMDVMGIISTILLMTSTIGGFGLGVAIFVLAISELAIDRPRAMSRDRYHWLGIFGPAGLQFLMIVLGVGFGNV